MLNRVGTSCISRVPPLERRGRTYSFRCASFFRLNPRGWALAGD